MFAVLSLFLSTLLSCFFLFGVFTERKIRSQRRTQTIQHTEMPHTYILTGRKFGRVLASFLLLWGRTLTQRNPGEKRFILAHETKAWPQQSRRGTGSLKQRAHHSHSESSENECMNAQPASSSSSSSKEHQTQGMRGPLIGWVFPMSIKTEVLNVPNTAAL